MTDMTSILSAAYKSAGSSTAIPIQDQICRGRSQTLSGHLVGNVCRQEDVQDHGPERHGFRAQVKYQSGGTVKFGNVLIKDKSFRIGDTKLTLGAKAGTAQVKNVVTDPATGSTFLDTAVATQAEFRPCGRWREDASASSWSDRGRGNRRGGAARLHREIA